MAQARRRPQLPASPPRGLLHPGCSALDDARCALHRPLFFLLPVGAENPNSMHGNSATRASEVVCRRVARVSQNASAKSAKGLLTREMEDLPICLICQTPCDQRKEDLITVVRLPTAYLSCAAGVAASCGWSLARARRAAA